MQIVTFFGPAGSDRNLRYIPVVLSLVLVVLSTAGCASAPASTEAPRQTDAAKAQRDSEAAAAAATVALEAMDRGGKVPGAAGTAPVSNSPQTPPAASPSAGASASPAASSTPKTPGPAASTGAKPAWVDAPERVYGKPDYISAVGSGPSREAAQGRALANLVAIFGQSVRSNLQILETYQETVRNGQVAGYQENHAITDAIDQAASMDTLVGAEIKDVWVDSGGTVYAVAVMEKAGTNTLYGQMIRNNLGVIDRLTNLPESEKYTLGGYIKYNQAGIFADTNQLYLTVLQIIGNTTGIAPGNIETGDYYRLEAAEIITHIPIGVEVEGDVSGRIKGAFAKVFNQAGFRSSGTNSRYVLKAVVVFSEPDYSESKFKYARLELSADLVDTTNNAVLLPYNLNRREGHSSYSEAQQRAIRWAESEITAKGKYDTVLSGYLSSLWH